MLLERAMLARHSTDARPIDRPRRRRRTWIVVRRVVAVVFTTRGTHRRRRVASRVRVVTIKSSARRSFSEKPFRVRHD